MENLIVKATKRRRFDFDLFFSYLLQYKLEYGDCLVPQNYIINGYKLGRRVNYIRLSKGLLSDEQRSLLDGIGFVWDAKRYFNFDEFYKHLVEYKTKFGDCRVPTNYIVNGYKLGQRVRSIRSGHIIVSNEQRLLLDNTGFIWDAKRYFNFDEFYKHLVEYKTEFGDCRVPINYIINGYKLGEKVHSIRSGNTKVNTEQRSQLDSIGFVWNALNHNFNEFYSYLIEYKAQFGSCKVPQGYVINGYKLGQKVQSIRSGNIKVNTEQRTLLDSIGFVWNATFYFNFDKFYKHLIEYKTQFGNCKVPQDYVINGYKLGQKVMSIRNGLINLTDEQKAELDKMGFVWSVYSITKQRNFDFDEFYRYLIKYKIQYNDINVPYDFILENYELGFYMRSIRTRRVRLTADQTEKLRDLGFVFDTHDLLYPNITYSTKDDSKYLAQHMLDGDMSARVMLYKKFIPVIYFYANKMPNKTLRDDAISYLSEKLLLILDRIRTSNNIFSYINKSMKGYSLTFLKNSHKDIEISIYTPKDGTDDLTIEDSLKSDENDNPDVIVNSRVFDEQLISAIKGLLTKSEFRLIAYYFGIDCERKTIEELANKYNVTDIKVKKAISRIVRDLKSELSESEWSDSF